MINQEVNIQADGGQIVSPDEDLTDDGGVESPPSKRDRTIDSRNGRSRERHFENTAKIMRRHSADAPIKRRASLGPETRIPQFRGRSASPFQGRSSSVPRKATFVDGEYIPGSTSLFRPTQARVSSMQAVYDRRQEIENLRNPQPVKVDSSYTPSDRLMRTTSSRVMAQVAWFEHQKELEQKKHATPVKIDEKYKPSDRLLKPTKTFETASQQWEKEKEERRLADDIWWEMRKSPEPYKSKIVATSKLTEPTKSSLANRHQKSSNGKGSDADGSTESPVKATVRPMLSSDNHLLRPTKASLQGSWKAEKEKELHPEEPPKPVLQLAAKNANTHVKSKLFEETSAAKYKKKIFAAELEQAHSSKSPSTHVTVKDVSSHLLKNPRARSKSPQAKKDPREVNWNSYATLSAAKSTLNQPLVEPIHTMFSPPKKESTDSVTNSTATGSSSVISPRLRPNTLQRLATPKHIASPPPSSSPGTLPSTASQSFGHTGRSSTPNTPSNHAHSFSSTATPTAASPRKSSTSKIPGPSPKSLVNSQAITGNVFTFADSAETNSAVDQSTTTATPAALADDGDVVLDQIPSSTSLNNANEPVIDSTSITSITSDTSIEATSPTIHDTDPTNNASSIKHLLPEASSAVSADVSIPKSET